MTLKVIQISDTHISLDVPQRMNDLENCVQAINQLTVQPDLVVHTGDVTHDGLAQEYHNARIRLNQLKVPYFVMPGNRDNRSALREAFSDSQYQLPPQGWVQYSIEQYAVRLIMVDTVSEQTNKGELCDERLTHLEQMLSADTARPVALFLHHPPFEATGIPDPYQYKDWNDVEKLTALLARFQHIQGMYCGHVHRFIDGSIADIKASAITCLAGDLRKGDVSEKERSLPIFKSLSL